MINTSKNSNLCVLGLTHLTSGSAPQAQQQTNSQFVQQREFPQGCYRANNNGGITPLTGERE
jgi:hypothetical protein